MGNAEHPGYLTPSSLKELCGEDGGFVCAIRSFEREIIDGRPQLVMYVWEDPRGIVISRQLYKDLCKLLGPPPPAIREFFASEGLH
jgi:hypothetical protein